MVVRWMGRNPLSIQVCFNGDSKKNKYRARGYVVIPYQFRSVSIRRLRGLDGFRGQRVVIPYQFRSVSIMEKITLTKIAN